MNLRMNFRRMKPEFIETYWIRINMFVLIECDQTQLKLLDQIRPDYKRVNLLE